VRVVRVGSIPFDLSVLIDEQPGSLVVWLLESEWTESMARVLEQVLSALYAVGGRAALPARQGLRAV
jgi:hypothetical protein